MHTLYYSVKLVTVLYFFSLWTNVLVTHLKLIEFRSCLSSGYSLVNSFLLELLFSISISGSTLSVTLPWLLHIIHEQEKVGGKVIHHQGGVIFLFRGRNYNYRTRPIYPLMLWKPAAPVYPRLVKKIPDGLTPDEAEDMRKRGRQLPPICKLGKSLCFHVVDSFNCLSNCGICKFHS